MTSTLFTKGNPNPYSKLQRPLGRPVPVWGVHRRNEPFSFRPIFGRQRRLKLRQPALFAFHLSRQGQSPWTEPTWRGTRFGCTRFI